MSSLEWMRISKKKCNRRNAKSVHKRERERERERQSKHISHISQKIYYINKNTKVSEHQTNVIYIHQTSKEVLLELQSQGLFKILTDTQKGKVPERESTRFIDGKGMAAAATSAAAATTAAASYASLCLAGQKFVHRKIDG